MDKTIKRNSKFQIKFILIFSLFLFFLFSLPKVAFSQECTQANEGETRPCNDCGIQICECVQQNGNISCSWSECQGEGVCCTENGFFRGTDYICDTKYKTQYKCEGTNCGDDILKRNCHKNRYCSGNSADCTGNWSSWICGSPSLFEDCESWQKCKDGTEWTDTQDQVCQCEGECLDKPEREETGLFNGKEYVSENNVNLPIKFDWKNVNGANSYFLKIRGEGTILGEWQEIENELIEGVSYLCSEEENYQENKEEIIKDVYNLLPYYRILPEQEWKEKVKELVEKWSTTDIEEKKNTICEFVENWVENHEDYQLIQTLSSDVLEKSEFFPENCLLRPNGKYFWKVIPCCGRDGTNCKPEEDVKEWHFSTSLAPELIFPLDPDWEGENFTQWTKNKPVTLDWCNTKEAETYRVKFYLVENGEENCHPLLSKEGECSYFEITKNTYPPFDELSSFFEDTDGYFFISNKKYKWEVASCFPKEGEIKCNFGQKWGFQTSEISPGEFSLLSPKNNALVGLPIEFTWNSPVGINSFWFEIWKGNQKIFDKKTTSRNLVLDYPALSLDEEYKWRVKPCIDYKCKECKEWTDFWSFKTTGKPPRLFSPSNGKDNVVLPVNFDWEDVPEVKSYVIQISEDQNFSQIVKENISSISEIKEDFPTLKQNTNYRWRVKSCAHENGEVCGKWSNIFSFKTFKLTSPKNLSIKEGNKIEGKPNVNFSWDKVPGAKVYQIKVTSFSGKEITKITPKNHSSFSIREFPETGDYNFKVRACLDKNCSEEGTSSWSNSFSFFLSILAPESQRGGLVPCGKPFDDPATNWDEREACSIHHLFLLLENILDLILWKLAIIFIVILVAILGFLLYISLGNYEIIWRVRSYLKFALIGYALIFGAWLIVSLLLSLMGYQIKIFGHWWEIKF